MMKTDVPEWAVGHRFCVDPVVVQGDEVRIVGRQAHQICRVLRLRPGDSIRVFHDGAAEYRVTLESVQPHEARGRITDQWRPTTEPVCRLWLAVPLLKAEKIEGVIQKAVELGVCGILLTRTQRTI